MKPIQVTIIGGGMIVHDQLLPSIYHLQRLGRVGDIAVVATTPTRINDLTSERFAEAFPGQSFTAHTSGRGAYRDAVAAMQPRNLVIVATPDALHDAMVRHCLSHDQHVLCVKPLVQTHADAVAIRDEAMRRGVFVGVEYHKRFDRRALEARRSYRAGRFGAFRLGYACLIEPYYYRASNFQNWFTKDQADPFTYVGCHYVDQVHFITGLKPVAVAVQGVEGAFPNGNRAWMWATGTVRFDNDALLTVNAGLGYPDAGPGPNDQGITMYCEGAEDGAVIAHNDQFRGVTHGYLDGPRFVNPDYFRLLPWPGEGLRPAGYGYDSVEANVLAATEVTAAGDLAARQATLRAIDARGLLATPGNSAFNEQVVEAARLSLAEGGRTVPIDAGA